MLSLSRAPSGSAKTSPLFTFPLFMGLPEKYHVQELREQALVSLSNPKADAPDQDHLQLVASGAKARQRRTPLGAPLAGGQSGAHHFPFDAPADSPASDLWRPRWRASHAVYRYWLLQETWVARLRSLLRTKGKTPPLRQPL